MRLFVLQRDSYLCQRCLRMDRLTQANIVHHIKELEDYPELALDPNNLESVCATCHNQLHPEKGEGKKLKDRAEIRSRRIKVIEVKANVEEV
ncbi:HNH endonuclease signature motif containing protein [Chengkuizengella axinellae]|uniref:Putative HNH nuclease YajD n=1 Tax=Chengkuizengella axinellae TaxID=3064388 RepID=A0ABT9IYB0_9BACL|nr:HNH endonuclease signature motif containing protein [Chengkuizengella sp. 2205SS18-9]MDP5274341.1 HNH endonuclease signature motif containing protein [Chengkuizengella sp. 2205SS18-9]